MTKKNDKKPAGKPAGKPADKAAAKAAEDEAKKKKPVAAPPPPPPPDDDDDDDDDEDDEDEDDDDDDDDDDEPASPVVLVSGQSRGAAAPKPKPKKSSEPDAWDESLAWIGGHGALPALALLTLALGVVYGGLFGGEIAGDDLTFHLAESARLSDCIRAGDFDWWNPSANAGYASAYYYQVIPQLASAIPAAIFGHLLFWFQLSNWLPLVLAPAAAYRGMRLLGATPWQAFAGAFAVGMMNGESRWGSGAAGSFMVGLYTQTWALSAFPLALGYGGRWIMRGEKLAPAVAWGAFVGLCHPFAVIGLGIALALGTIARMFPTRTHTSWSSWVGALLAICGILTLLIPAGSAFAWLPYFAVPFGLAASVALPFAFQDREAKWKFRTFEQVGNESGRLVVLGVLMVLAWMPVWLPLLADYAGFGGFPHRVADEIGPGFTALVDWFVSRKILDWNTVGTRWPILTWILPVVLIFARGPILRWFWVPAALFAFALGIGPHMSTTQDDLLPMVRFLGAMQTLLAMGIGAGVVIGGSYLWKAAGHSSATYGLRTVIACAAAVLLVLIAVPGGSALQARVHTMPEWTQQHHDELMQIADKLESLPPARKQAGPGTENHWWNLLTYVYGRTPSLLQMGGGGLQSSPNYDFLWSGRDATKNAWIYDAPYLVFARDKAAKAPGGDTLFQTTALRLRPYRTSTLLWWNLRVFALPGGYEIRKLPAPGLVSPVEVTGVLPPGNRKGQPGHDAALAWLRSDLPLADHVLAYDGFGGISGTPDGHTLTAYEQLSPGNDPDIVATVQANKPTTFIFRVSWHPRWHGYVDGNEVPVRRVTPDFAALDVPVGAHEISLRFERPWWAIADWLAWPGVSLAAWFLLRLWRKKHPLVAHAELPQATIVPGWRGGGPVAPAIRAAALRQVIIGGLLMAGGLTVSIVTYASINGAGTYIVAYGPIVAGAVMLSRGLSRLTGG